MRSAAFSLTLMAAMASRAADPAAEVAAAERAFAARAVASTTKTAFLEFLASALTTKL